MSNSSFNEGLSWLQDLPLSSQIHQSPWLFPMIETVHVFALALVFGSILMVDLRLLGWVNGDRSYGQFASELLPWTWAFFAMAASSGLLMFISKAPLYIENTPFRIKVAGLLLAGLNTSLFQFFGKRNLKDWDTATPPLGARISGAVSVLLWTGIVAAGRRIGFTT